MTRLEKTREILLKHHPEDKRISGADARYLMNNYLIGPMKRNQFASWAKLGDICEMCTNKNDCSADPRMLSRGDFQKLHNCYIGVLEWLENDPETMESKPGAKKK